MATIDTNGSIHPGPVSNRLDTLNSRYGLRNQYTNADAGQPRLDGSLNQIRAAFGETDVAQRLVWVIDTPDGRAILELGGPMSYWSTDHPDDVHGSWLVIGGSPAVMDWIRRALANTTA
jgi:hypothetical protein